MGVAGKLLKGIGRRAADKVMDRVGGKLVSRIADTSADAPSAFHEPKRDVYRHMKDGAVAAPPAVQPAASQGDAANAGEDDRDGHGHDHGHDHDHDDH